MLLKFYAQHKNDKYENIYTISTKTTKKHTTQVKSTVLKLWYIDIRYVVRTTDANSRSRFKNF